MNAKIYDEQILDEYLKNPPKIFDIKHMRWGRGCTCMAEEN